MKIHNLLHIQPELIGALDAVNFYDNVANIQYYTDLRHQHKYKWDCPNGACDAPHHRSCKKAHSYFKSAEEGINETFIRASGKLFGPSKRYNPYSSHHVQKHCH